MGKIKCVWSHRNSKPEKEKRWISNNFLHEFQSKTLFTNGIHSLVKHNVARGSAYIICIIWLIMTCIPQTRLTNN